METGEGENHNSEDDNHNGRTKAMTETVMTETVMTVTAMTVTAMTMTMTAMCDRKWGLVWLVAGTPSLQRR